MKTFTGLVLALGATSAYAFSSLTMSLSRSEILKPFHEGRAFKVISGLTNFDGKLVERVSRAAGLGGATHLDIAADPELVRIAKKHAPNLQIMVSAIDPRAFVEPVRAGADMLELGNFDSFYDQGLRFNSMDIIDLTSRTRQLFPDIPLSVTVPHILDMEEQVALAQSLEELGADVIQTEGSTSSLSRSGGIQGSIERAAPALAATYVLSRAVRIPVMAASGITEVTAPMAMVAGAKGIGVGSAINKLGDDDAMIDKVIQISQSLNFPFTRKVAPTRRGGRSASSA